MVEADSAARTATVVAVRGGPAQGIEYRVLCESSLLFLLTSPPTHITDHRLAEVVHNVSASGIDKPEDVRTVPLPAIAITLRLLGGRSAEEATDHAVTGQIPSQLIALFSDGAARSVELFGQDTWESVARLFYGRDQKRLSAESATSTS